MKSKKRCNGLSRCRMLHPAVRGTAEETVTASDLYIKATLVSLARQQAQFWNGFHDGERGNIAHAAGRLKPVDQFHEEGETSGATIIRKGTVQP